MGVYLKELENKDISRCVDTHVIAAFFILVKGKHTSVHQLMNKEVLYRSPVE